MKNCKNIIGESVLYIFGVLAFRTRHPFDFQGHVRLLDFGRSGIFEILCLALSVGAVRGVSALVASYIHGAAMVTVPLVGPGNGGSRASKMSANGTRRQGPTHNQSLCI